MCVCVCVWSYIVCKSLFKCQFVQLYVWLSLLSSDESAQEDKITHIVTCMLSIQP